MVNLKELHESDFNRWVEEIKTKIQRRDIEDMDWDNLFDEIEDMGASQKRSLDSYMQRLIEHILKLQYWESESERCRNGWMAEIANFRSRINRIIRKNPSLKNYLATEYDDIYQDAVKAMKFQFHVPDDCRISLAEIMTEDYLTEDS
jgi:type I site-specific restriction-modification system R (restriction) subunit